MNRTETGQVQKKKKRLTVKGVIKGTVDWGCWHADAGEALRGHQRNWAEWKLAHMINQESA